MESWLSVMLFVWVLLLVSQMGQMDGSQSGDLVLYRPGGEIRVLFPAGELTDDRSWGDESCPPPDTDAFSPHGLDLVRRDDGFFVTHMFPLEGQTLAMFKGALLGSDTGHVYEWGSSDGWQIVSGSEGPFPNGIEMSEDEDTLYINMYLAGEVRKLDLASGAVRAVYEGGNPDNSTWSDDGRLLVATHVDGLMESMACQGISQGSCGFDFRIVALDPVDLRPTTVVEHRGAPMGGVTVAREMGGGLYLGTFAGDRIARFDRPAP